KKTNLDESNFKQGGYVWILTDITIPVFLESQLRESQKMEAVGRLAGGVAHDFNNLLTVIMGYCSLILDNSELLKKDKTLKNDILGIHSTSQKAVNLTKQLLTFSNNQVHTPRHINLNMIIKDLNKIFDRLIPDYICLTNFLTDDDTIINVDPVQIEQVLINLVVNSKDAISNKGYIHIRTSIIDSTEEIKNNTGVIPKGEFVLLSIEDNGCGISDEIQTKIFEPFFTTKKEGKGIGLGLSTVYGIVLHSGAYMDLKSSPGKGCIFKIYFPRVLDSIPEKVIPVEYKHMDAGKETVLIVEEDEFVRSIMLRILTIKGYTVIEACHAGEALLLCEKMEDICELMITDLFMPQITGQELFRRISKFFPQIKCLYTSTNNLESIKDKSLVNGINNYIQKPFDPEDFSLLVRKSLDSN
ncbi:MAG: response regulator, partial [Spirochaetaceae bacterium]|nr:response regulator [Spirochaetaceae bacterium]